MKKRAIIFLLIFFVGTLPRITMAENGIIKKFLVFDEWVKNNYDGVRSTFLGNAVLNNIGIFVPLGLSIVFMDKFKKLLFKLKPKNTAVIVEDTTLADYAGTVPPAVITLVDQIKNREFYQAVNAPVTKGILLTGLPGTGKSFLARAIAGEVKCPFFATSATEFSQSYVGMGEAMIRDIFNDARRAAAHDPSKLAIIFVDEIDAIGKRNATFTGGIPHGILHTFLTEMDGFNKTAQVPVDLSSISWYIRMFLGIPRSITVDVDIVILAATNTPDSLDEALRRAGRFDNIIEVKKPDKDGRRAIIALYIKKYPCNETVNADRLVQLTEDMSPADINTLFGEAARDAGSKKQTIIGMENFEYALLNIKRVIVGQ